MSALQPDQPEFVSNLITCPDCGYSHSPHAEACPRCGRFIQRSKPPGNWKGRAVAIGGLLLLAVAAWFFAAVLSASREHERARMTVERAAIQCRADVRKSLGAAETLHQANPQLTTKQAYELYAATLSATCR